MESIGMLLILLFVASVYLLPTIFAIGRGHRNALAIFALNATVGWMGWPWLIAFIWSLTSNVKPTRPQIAQFVKPRPYKT